MDTTDPDGYWYCCLCKKNILRQLPYTIILLLLLFNDGHCVPILLGDIDDTLVHRGDRTAKLPGSREVRLFLRNSTEDSTVKVWARIARQTDKALVKDIRSKRTKRRGDHVISLLPTNRRIVRLKSKTGFFLEILPGDRVGGNVNKTKYTRLELLAMTPIIRCIRGVETNKYLAINRKGKVVLRDMIQEDTYFYEEHLENYEFAYSSVKYSNSKAQPMWYLGLKRKNSGSRRTLIGKTKRASRTLPGDLAAHFQIMYDDL